MILWSRLSTADANTFAAAAAVYWLEVFPHVRRELRHWRERAGRIADPRLARLALDTQAEERGNLEGAAVFALLAPRPLRRRVIRASVAFQALYDLLDTLAELPVADPRANGRALHMALPAALDPCAPVGASYLRHCGFPPGEERYVHELIAACRGALEGLPGYAHVHGPVGEAAERMVEYQSLNHLAPGEDPRRMAIWGSSVVPASSGLRWWESAAGAASSLGVFALLAAASSAALDEAEATAIAGAYFPWAGALHVLLDSLVDLDRDLDREDHSLVSHYGGPAQTADRLGTLAAEAARRLRELGPGHRLILGAMAAFYLSEPTATGGFAKPTADRVLAELGPGTSLAMALLRARRVAGSASRKSSSGVSTCRVPGVA